MRCCVEFDVPSYRMDRRGRRQQPCPGRLAVGERQDRWYPTVTDEEGPMSDWTARSRQRTV